MSQKQAKQRRRERREIQVRLAEQLRLLTKRCQDFDKGDFGEAIDIATRLRVILNPGGSSTPSVLQSLDVQKVQLLSTCRDIPEQALVANSLIQEIHRKDGRGDFYEVSAPLEHAVIQRYMRHGRWWEQVVWVKLVGGEKHVFRRKDVINDVANKDGGAHVARDVLESYDVMSKPGILRISPVPGADVQQVLMAGRHLVLLRQMAYEVLNSPELLKLADL